MCLPTITVITIYVARFSVGRKQTQGNNLTIRSSPPCGKICSYEWDVQQSGKYYPLLYKVVNCSNIIYRMAYSPYRVTRPPPRRPPPNMLKNFTIDGQCPVSRYWYFDESRGNNSPFVMSISKYLVRDKFVNINPYKDKNALKPALVKYRHLIRGKQVAVIGTRKPWAEAILLNLGANSITTIEYKKLIIRHKRVKTTTPYRVAKQFIYGKPVLFDTVFTYSSLEHSGLGRYGDPLTPFGDLEATAQVWCMVKPGGHFILGVPVSSGRQNCSVWWNAGRVYGDVRLQHLTANWQVLEEFKTFDCIQFDSSHSIFVLKKAQLV